MRSSVQSVQGALSKVWILETRPIVRLYISFKNRSYVLCSTPSALHERVTVRRRNSTPLTPRVTDDLSDALPIDDTLMCPRS